MVYQISEKNQILIALFGIVVLCAGKIFKDYLKRSGYVEGFTFTTETTPTRLIRTTSDINNAAISLRITLDKDLATSGTIRVQWSFEGTDIVFPVAGSGEGNYIATIESGPGVTFSADTSALGSKSVTFTSSGKIDAKSWIKIVIRGVTINGKAADASDNVDRLIKFTVTPSNTEPVVSRDVKVSRTGSGGAADKFTSSATMTVEEIDNAIAAIDARLSVPSLSDAEKRTHLNSRAALISMLASTYGTVKEAGQVFDSDALYQAQKTAIDFIEKEQSRSEKNAQMLKEDNSNKRRMAQVNTYYTRHYEENTDVMKNIIYISVALIILAVLRNKELIPASISTLGIILVLAFGGIVIGTQVYDIIRRNDHDFDKYDWNFNEDKLNNAEMVQQNSDPVNLSEMGMGMAPCYGPGCCDTKTLWDANLKRCVASRITGSATWSTTAAGSAAGILNLALKNSYVGQISQGGSITVTLPTGMFELTGGSTPFGAMGGATASTGTATSFILSSSALVEPGATIAGIEIRGLSLLAGHTGNRNITVRTNVDPNASTIPITVS